MLKTVMAVMEIPKELWDTPLRIMSSKLNYEIVKASIACNEIFIARRIVMGVSLKTFTKEWYTIPELIMIPEEQVSTKKEAKKDAKKGKE